MKNGNKWRLFCALLLPLIAAVSFTATAANGFVFEDSDTRILTEKDVEGLPINVLRLAINEIYARHGRIYETADLASYFSSQSWYDPKYKASDFNESKLFNSTEAANVKFLSDWKDAYEKELVLQEISYKYSSSLYILPDSNSRYLQDSDVGMLTKEELRYAINEIYARHGRIYESKDLNSYFMTKGWYTPSIKASEFSEDVLFNEYEKDNIQFLSSVQNDSQAPSIIDQTITPDNVSAFTYDVETAVNGSLYNSNNSTAYNNNSTTYDNNKYTDAEETDWLYADLDPLYTNPDGSIDGEALENVLDELVSSGAEFDSKYFPNKFAKDRQKVVDFLEDYKAKKYDRVYVEVSKKALKETLDRGTYSYYGEMKNNQPNGLGLVIDADNGQKLFCGYFKKGKPSGYGIVFDADKKGYSGVYEGSDCGMNVLINLVHFYASGDGFIYDNPGTFVFEGPVLAYVGKLNKNNKDGKGTEYITKSRKIGTGPVLYEGSYKNNEYSGSGTLYYSNGSIQYKGDFKKGRYDGKGTLYNQDGSVKYKGKFKKGDIAN